METCRRIMVMALLLLPVTTAYADSKVIRIGGEDNPPVSSISANGKAKGLFPDVFEDIARQEGWKFEYVPCAWDKCLDALAKGDLDLLLATAHSPKRAEVFDFTDESLLSNWGCVYVPRDEKIESILQLEGKRIAVVRNDTHALAFRKLLADFGKQATYVEVEKLEDVLKSIDRGEAEAGVVNRLFGQKRMKNYRVDATPIVFNPIEIKFAVPKGKHHDIVAALDKHIAKQKKDHDSLYAKSFERWLNIGTPTPILPEWFWPVVSATIIATILLITGVVLLRYEVRRKTLALTIAMEEAESLQRLFSAAFDNTFQLQGLLTPDGKIVNVNKASLDVIGAKRESVIGHFFWETPWWTHDPDEQQRIKDVIGRCARGEVIHFETTHRDLTGDLHYVDFSLKPLRDTSGAIIYLIPEGRDVSRYKKIQNDLLQREEELQSLFMAAPIGIAYVKDRVFIKVNDAMCRLYGYTHDEIVGQSARKLYGSDAEYEAVGAQLYAAAMEHGSAMVELRTITRNGEALDIVLGLAPLVRGDASSGFVSLHFDVTEKKKAFAALEESEKRFQAIFDESPMVMSLYDAQTGAFVDVNRRYCEFHGITRDAIGKTPDEAGILHSDEFKKAFEEYSRRGFIDQMEIKCLGADGSAVYMLISARTIGLSGKQYAVVVSQDITARILAENQLRESETKYRNIFENAPIGIFQSLPGGRFLSVNGTYAEIFGYSTPEEMIASVTDITNQLYVDPDQRADILERLQTDDSVTTNDVQVRRKDGTTIYVDLYMRAVRGGNGAVEQLEGFLADVTQRKQTETFMLQNEKLSMVAGMAAGIAHEVNNPLGIISQNIQNLERRFSPALPVNQKVANELGIDLDAVNTYMERREIVEYLSSMLLAVKRASNIISSMLQFSRPSDASHQLCSINDVIEQSIRLASNDFNLRKKYDLKNITIIREFDEQRPQVSVCITEMEQVFINLLKNAAQAMFNAGTIQPTIVLRTSCSDEYVVAVIRDNGPGMTGDVCKRIFDPFFTTKDIGAGTGLGLSVSYTIVTKNHGGKLSVESQPDQGACFTIQLPLSNKGQAV